MPPGAGCAVHRGGVNVVDNICGQSYTLYVAEVHFHPEFARQFEELCGDPEMLEIAGEISQLIDALATYGHEIEGEDAEDASHPVVTARVRMFALRRTPPTGYTPYADAPPVLRIPYVWFVDGESGGEVAVVMFIGDKTALANAWYPSTIATVEGRLIHTWTAAHPKHRPLPRRPRR